MKSLVARSPCTPTIARTSARRARLPCRALLDSRVYWRTNAAVRGGLNQLFSIVQADEDDAHLPGTMKQLLRVLVVEIRAADAHIAELDRQLKDDARTR